LEKTKQMFYSAKKIIPLLLAGQAVLIGILFENALSQEQISIIPKPAKLERHAGQFTLRENTKILNASALPEAGRFAQQMAEKLRSVTGLSLPLVETADTTSAPDAILFCSANGDTLGREGYRLSVAPATIQIAADSAAGFFYAIQSLYQLLPAEIESDKREAAISWTAPCCLIEDQPRFRWRGAHLDVGRHLFPVAFIKKYIDLLAMYKMNTLHWHLTEDQGWRIEIKKYPLLTTIGGWRKQTLNDRTPYGGFYTQEEVREIVAYARQHAIEVVPEIEMPGHALAALASYPWLSCTGGPFEVGTRWGVYEDVYCAGKETTFEFLENVLSEVMELFPSQYIHIGGDEVPKTRWRNHDLCQNRIRAENLKNENELQSYFIKRIERFLSAKGRRLIGWDEILEGGLPPNATVMSWRGTEGGIAAARSGHDVVMSPTTHCYFDYYQGKIGEPPAIGGYLPIEKVYSFEPVPAELTTQESQHVLGAQANVWTEYMRNATQVEYMLLPRLCAMSEVVWSQKEQRDWNDFSQRLAPHYERLSIKNTNFRRPPTAFFDGANLGTAIATLGFWGEAPGSGIEAGTGARLGSDAVKWVQKNTGEESGVYWAFQQPQNLRLAMPNMVLTIAANIPANSDTIFINFISENRKRLGSYLPPAPGLFDGLWHKLSLYVRVWNAEPGFDSTKVVELAIWTKHGMQGLAVHLADLWMGYPEALPRLHSPIVFFDGYGFNHKFRLTGFPGADASSGVETGAGVRPGTNALKWVHRASGQASRVRWQFESPADMTDMVTVDTLKLSLKVPAINDTIIFRLSSSNGNLDYYLSKEAGLFDGNWQQLELPLKNWVASPGFVANSVLVFSIMTAHGMPGLVIYLADIWLGTPPASLITIISDDANENSLPTEYRLEQNYPNPFNAITAIRYALPKSGFVTLQVYNMLGQKAATLVDEQKASGFYTVKFNTESLASGVYFYRLQAGSEVLTKRLLLIK